MQFSFYGRWTNVCTTIMRCRSCKLIRIAVCFKMLLMWYVVVLAVRSYCHANEVFPEALVYEELGLADMVVNKSATTDNRNDTFLIAGNLNDALMTMNFHRWVHNILFCIFQINVWMNAENINSKKVFICNFLVSWFFYTRCWMALFFKSMTYFVAIPIRNVEHNTEKVIL